MLIECSQVEQELEIENAVVIRPPLYLQLGKNLETTVAI
jgi:hypothetical protein